MRLSLGLVLATVSAVAINWAYLREHDAAADLAPVSARHPFQAARVLLGSRGWLVGFGAESGGWLVYVAALRLAPLALVQALGGAGVAILALGTSHGHLGRLPRREQVALAAVIAGLCLLGLSLTGVNTDGRQPGLAAVLLWCGGIAGAALFLRAGSAYLSKVAGLGLSAGLLFAIGDITVKLAVHGGIWLLVLPAMGVAYALGSIELQAAFQRGDVLTAAGLATLATNAVPVAAGVVLFHEDIPPGARGGEQIAAFATLLLGGVLLNRRGQTAE